MRFANLSVANCSFSGAILLIGNRFSSQHWKLTLDFFQPVSVNCLREQKSISCLKRNETNRFFNSASIFQIWLIGSSIFQSNLLFLILVSRRWRHSCRRPSAWQKQRHGWNGSLAAGRDSTPGCSWRSSGNEAIPKSDLVECFADINDDADSWQVRVMLSFLFSTN